MRSRVVQTGLWCLVAAALTLGARELVAHTRRGRFAPPAAASSPGDARLSVWSSPSGAQVFEGAQLAGTTPLTLSRPSGRVELTFRYDGFATETRTFELVAGANSQVISLSPQPP